MTINIEVEHLSGRGVRKYIKDNCKSNKDGFWTVEKELKVWKATRLGPIQRPKGFTPGGRVIVALRIPAGAQLFALPLDRYSFDDDIDDRKMRASAAFVEKQFYVGSAYTYNHYSKTREIELSECTAIKKSFATYDQDFAYRTGHIVKPSYNFSTSRSQCVSGIHFFVNLTDAMEYT